MKRFFHESLINRQASSKYINTVNDRVTLSIRLNNARAQLAWVPWVPVNPQIFEKYEMEPTDFDEMKGLYRQVKCFFIQQPDLPNW